MKIKYYPENSNDILMFDIFLPNLTNILGIFVAFLFNLPFRQGKKKKRGGGSLQKNTSTKQGATKINSNNNNSNAFHSYDC